MMTSYGRIRKAGLIILASVCLIVHKVWAKKNRCSIPFSVFCLLSSDTVAGRVVALGATEKICFKMLVTVYSVIWLSKMIYWRKNTDCFLWRNWSTGWAPGKANSSFWCCQSFQMLDKGTCSIYLFGNVWTFNCLNDRPPSALADFVLTC